VTAKFSRKSRSGVTLDVEFCACRTLVSDGATVMVEQVSNSSVRGNPISSLVMAVFEFDADGRIKQWREAYDLKSAMDQIEAAVQRHS
jgi:limonene-1,2-epoxide hydrolase